MRQTFDFAEKQQLRGCKLSITKQFEKRILEGASNTLRKMYQLSPSFRKSSHQVNQNISLDDFGGSAYFYEGV